MTAALLLLSIFSVAELDKSTQRDELAELRGSVVLAGTGELSSAARSAFVDLAGGAAARIVVVGAGAAPEGWVDGALRLDVEDSAELRSGPGLEALLRADGIWLASPTDTLVEAPLFVTLVDAALARGAVIGGAGEDARTIAGTQGLGLVPRIDLLFGANDAGNDDDHHRHGREHPGRFVAALPDGAALAIFGGRKIALVGEGEIGFAAYGPAEEMVDEQVLPCDAHAQGDRLRAQLDLLAWVRMARAANEAPHPPLIPEAPSVVSGALVVQGGGGVTDVTWERFIELAGGADARFVCIPSASEMEDDAAPDSYSARELEERGCANVRIVHAATRRHSSVTAALDEADAVWIDGGRTFRFMDRFERTAAAKAIARVLERGGVVGGSSAGCQVIGDLLVRGNPRSNSDMTHPGYLRGLGLLSGVVFDAHFRERNRYGQLAGLVSDHPQVLGIGVDAGAALVIQGSVAEVTGESGVNVYDRRHGGAPPEHGAPYEPGARFDLVSGQPIAR